MSKRSVKLTLNTDDDGFVSQECPTCNRVFKVEARDGDGVLEMIGFCPYCGHSEKGCWWTKAQARYIEKLLSHEVIEPSIADFQKRNRQVLSRPGSMVTVKSVPIARSSKPRAPREPSEEMTIHLLGCCGNRVKHLGEVSFCPFCGENQPSGKP